MEKKTSLTKEQLINKFKSKFELVNYAISLAENMIRTGRESRVKSEVQNRAMLIVEEIIEGKDQFDPIPEPKAASLNQVHATEDALKPKIVMEEKFFERRKSKVLLQDDEE